MRELLLPLACVLAKVAAQSNEYEYVVIGSGPGGGPLAANLARAGHSVFVIEAGEDHGDSLIQQMPSFADPVAEDPTMSWEFFVTHYKNTTQAHRDTKYTWQTPDNLLYVGTSPPSGSEPLGILYPRTGTLGGCGNHNAMNLALPPDNDWDDIARLTGDDSWLATNMRTYYQELERNTYIADRNGSAGRGHGFDGWLASNRNQIDLLGMQDGFVEILRDLFAAIGTHVPQSSEETLALLQRDLNRLDAHRYENNDLQQIPLHYDERRRRSSSQTYLRDTINERYENGSQRYPLTISTSSLATRLIFDNANNNNGTPRAVGVEYLRGQALYKADRRYNGVQRGTPANVTATREVIVAGGAFNTPQILKLSGVGPREELEKFDIPVILDLPAVGTNLQDNYEAGVHVQASRDYPSPFENCTDLAPGDPCLREWQDHGTGAYGISAPVSLLYKSSMSETNDTDLFYFGGAGAVFDGYYPGWSQAGPAPNSTFWSIVKMQPQNRAGTVTLRSADPQDVPDINFNYFQEGREHDLQALAEGVAFVLDAYNRNGSSYGPYTVIRPDPEVEVKQAIMDQAFSHHASCSCPMGLNGTDSCVDSRFRVHGIDGLRVVDGSVFPRIPGGFPILPTFMISQKASHVIMEDAASNGTGRRSRH